MPNIDQVIERWENVQRVLRSMTPHERKHHFDMQIWGRKTDCGTVACAAGHCSLDPWFRKRRFVANFDSDEYHLMPKDGDFTDMIDDFFVIPNKADWDQTPDEIFELTEEATDVFYGTYEKFGEVMRYIQRSITALKKYRDRVKKA